MENLERKIKNISTVNINTLNNIKNSEDNENIKIKLNYLIDRYTYVHQLINLKKYCLALETVELIKQWRSNNINEYFFISSNPECNFFLKNVMDLKINLLMTCYT